MNPTLVAVVLAIGAGAVVAVSTRDGAAAAIGLAVSLIASALLAEPLPPAGVLGDDEDSDTEAAPAGVGRREVVPR